ncbi:MAG: IS1595 family transposase [Cytophagales bacterium]|nr:IS1595 family transposase [Cytophagales bacterium]
MGTIFENSNLDLRVWLAAFYATLTGRKGISSIQLAKELGVTQKTAWFMQHRIREACTQDNSFLLSGIVEADETYIGGIEANKHMSNRTDGTQGRSTKTKVAVVGLKERGGRVRSQSDGYFEPQSDTGVPGCKCGSGVYVVY